MAYSVYSPETQQFQEQVNAITNRWFRKSVENCVYESCPLLMRLQAKKKVKHQGGSAITWPVKIAKLGTADFVDPRAAVTYSTTDNIKGAMLNWKFGLGYTLINWDEIAKNRNSPEQIVNLIKEKMSDLKADWEDMQAQALYAASPAAEDMESLVSCISESEYAGIDPDNDIDTAAYWQGIVEDTANSDLGLYDSDVSVGTSLYSLINASKFGNKGPTVIIVSRARFDYLDEIGGDKVRIEDKLSYQLGFDNIKIKGVPIIADPFCPDDMVFGIDEDAVEFITHSAYDRKVGQWRPHESYPNALFNELSWAGNLKFKRRHTSFIITDLASL